jgi:hypothetical protein
MKRLSASVPAFLMSILVVGASGLLSPTAAQAAASVVDMSFFAVPDALGWVVSMLPIVGMAVGTKSDFEIYPEQFYGGFQERLARVVDVFDAASAGALNLVSRRIKGDFEKESFMQRISGMVQHRDTTSVSDVSDKKLQQGQFVRPKINRRLGPVAETLDAFKKMAEDPETFSFLFGQQIADDVAEDYVDTILTATTAALESVGSNDLVADETDGKLSHQGLNAANFLLGDRAGRVAAYVMHSGAMEGLVDDALGKQMDSVAGTIIYGGGAGSLGRPIVMTDSDALVIDDIDSSTSGNQTGYRTLALVDGAGAVIESEEREIASEMITGKENLMMRIQGEYAFNIEVKGFAFNESEVNPDSTAYSAGANWTQVMEDNKDLAGAIVKTQ